MKNNRYEANKDDKDLNDIKLISSLLSSKKKHTCVKINVHRKKNKKYQEIEVTPTTIENGKLNESYLGVILEDAYTNKQLRNSDFTDVSKIKIINIFDQMHGEATKQLFLIQTNKNDYILKELACGENTAKLMKKAMSIKELKPFINNKTNNYPVLVLPWAYLTCTHGTEKLVLALMNKAPGITLLQLMNEFETNTSKQQVKKVAIYYKNVGTSTARLHKHFMNGNVYVCPDTLLHSDFHIGNVLFDETTNQVSFIDNEQLVTRFYERGNPASEVLRLLIGPSNKSIPSENLSKENKQKWVYITFKNFIEGYLSMFENLTVRNKLICSIIEILKTTHFYTLYKQSIDSALFKAKIKNKILTYFETTRINKRIMK